MNRLEAQDLAEALMAQWRLDGWRLEWSKSITYLGRCSYQGRVIRLSLPYVLSNPEEQVRDTVLHEIAHALAGLGAGHGSDWRAMARRLGATPRAKCRLYVPPQRMVRQLPAVDQTAFAFMRETATEESKEAVELIEIQRWVRDHMREIRKRWKRERLSTE